MPVILTNEENDYGPEMSPITDACGGRFPVQMTLNGLADQRDFCFAAGIERAH